MREIISSILVICLFCGNALGCEPSKKHLQTGIDGNIVCQAIMGDKVAQFRLAKIYDLGESVPRDSRLALKWYRRAARDRRSDRRIVIGAYPRNNWSSTFRFGGSRVPGIKAAQERIDELEKERDR